MSTTSKVALVPQAQTSESVPANPPSTRYNASIGYLRAFVTILVVAHHAALGYHPYAPPPAQSLVTPPQLWQVFPVVDSQRWSGFALLVSFNDIFFMSLMFLISGQFVLKSLQRKGGWAFLRDRFLRLGVPFVVAAALIAPLAYYPAYLQTGATQGLAGFWQQWRALGNWPAGPAWFIWLLLAFDCAAVALFVSMPRWGDALGRLSASASRRPAVFMASLVLVSAAAYIPMEFAFNGYAWTGFGPFAFQTSRLLHYAVYFLAGAAIGAYGIERGLLASDGKLARRWFLWVPASLIVFAIALALIIRASTSHLGSRAWEAIGDAGFVVSCAATSFALLALFVRFGNKRVRMLDSLKDNAYGMYLIHYPIVSWLQYAMLRTQLSGVAKGTIVFIVAVVLSWSAIAALKRVPAVARVI